MVANHASALLTERARAPAHDRARGDAPDPPPRGRRGPRPGRSPRAMRRWPLAALVQQAAWSDASELPVDGPRVSVVVATWNRAAEVATALRSLQAQTVPSLGGHRRRRRQRRRHRPDREGVPRRSRITYERIPHGGAAVARNHGLDASGRRHRRLPRQRQHLAPDPPRPRGAGVRAEPGRGVGLVRAARRGRRRRFGPGAEHAPVDRHPGRRELLRHQRRRPPSGGARGGGRLRRRPPPDRATGTSSCASPPAASRCASTPSRASTARPVHTGSATPSRPTGSPTSSRLVIAAGRRPGSGCSSPSGTSRTSPRPTSAPWWRRSTVSALTCTCGRQESIKIPYPSEVPTHEGTLAEALEHVRPDIVVTHWLSNGLAMPGRHTRGRRPARRAHPRLRVRAADRRRAARRSRRARAHLSPPRRSVVGRPPSPRRDGHVLRRGALRTVHRRRPARTAGWSSVRRPAC